MSRINEIAAYLYLQSAENYLPEEPGYGAMPWTIEDWERHDRNYAIGSVDPDECEARARNFVTAMAMIFPLIEEDMTAEEIQTLFYDAGKATYGKENLRMFFKDVYLMLTGRPDGARIGVLISVWGVNQFKEKMRSRMDGGLV